jgi:hypothetical protein
MSGALSTSHDLGMNREDAHKLTVNQFLGLFGCAAIESRSMAYADSEEYLAVVTYLVERSSAR